MDRLTRMLVRSLGDAAKLELAGIDKRRVGFGIYQFPSAQDLFSGKLVSEGADSWYSRRTLKAAPHQKL